MERFSEKPDSSVEVACHIKKLPFPGSSQDEDDGDFFFPGVPLT